jgi:GT2 family glycosyltransferase
MKWAHERGSEWLWLMDDDTIPSRTALQELLAARARFTAGDQPNLLASKVVWTDGSLHTMNPCLVKQPDLEALYRSVEQGTMSIRTSTFVSCLLHRDLVRRYGLPIADYFIWGDDTEYTARILRSEFGVMAPASIAVHKTAKKHTALDAPPQRYYYHVRNMLWMITRSRAWSGKEKLRLTFTLAAWIARYFRIRGFQFASIKAVGSGFVDGVFTSPRDLRLEPLITERGNIPERTSPGQNP